MTITKKYLLISLPVSLIISTAMVFVFLSLWLGKPLGYVTGFLFYSLGWCLLVPFVFLGKDGFVSLFIEANPLFSKKNGWLLALLILTVIGAFFSIGPDTGKSPTLVLVCVAVFSTTLISTGEEILWRGLFVKVFPDNIFLGLFFPSLGYAFWHFVPLLIYQSNVSGGSFGFVGFVFLLGLCYALVAYLTGSCKWTALFHSLNGIIVMGGILPPIILSLWG